MWRIRFLKYIDTFSVFIAHLRQLPTNIERGHVDVRSLSSFVLHVSYMFFKFLWVVRRVPINGTSNGIQAHTSVVRSANDKDILTDVISSAVCGGSQAVNGGGLKIHSHRSSRVRIPPSASTQNEN